MKLVYYKSPIGNFGDDLNPYIFNKLLGNFEDYSDIDFVGIGSIIDDRLKSDKTKVVFGSGLRDVSFKPNDSFDFRFVRGPLSSKILNAEYISDAAYLIALLNIESYKKEYKLSFMPYYTLYSKYNWKIFEKLSGIHIISPLDKPEKVIAEIAKSEKLISTAMHGAIVADCLRVPWKRFVMPHRSEDTFFSEFKWKDWLLSVNIKDSVPLRLMLNTFPAHNIVTNKFIKTFQLIEVFYRASKTQNKYYLSHDEVYKNVVEKLDEEITLFKKAYKL